MKKTLKKTLKAALIAFLAIALVAASAFVTYRILSAKEPENPYSKEDFLAMQKELEETKQQKQSLIDKLTTPKYVFDSETLSEKIQSIGELATVEYIYTDVGVVESSKTLKIFKKDVPMSTKRVIAQMDGVIKVGIDVDMVEIACDEAQKLITVTLPNARLLSNELDEQSLTVYDEDSGLFNKVTMEDSSLVRTVIKEEAEKGAEKNGLYEQAKENAKLIITNLFYNIPGLMDTYTVEIH